MCYTCYTCIFIYFSHTLRVDLIPLGVDFKGYFEVLFVPVEFIIFTWKADLIEGSINFVKNCICSSFIFNYKSARLNSNIM